MGHTNIGSITFFTETKMGLHKVNRFYLFHRFLYFTAVLFVSIYNSNAQQLFVFIISRSIGNDSDIL